MISTFLGLLSGEAVMRALALVASLIIVRVLSPAGFGSFAFALAFAGIMGLTVDFGLSLLLMRETSANPEGSPRVLGVTLVTVAVVGAAVIAVAAGLTLTGVVSTPVATGGLMLALGAAIADAGTMAFEATLLGHGRAALLPAIRAVRGTALVIAVMAASLWLRTPLGFLGASLVSSLAAAGVAGLACARRAARPAFAGAVPEIWPLLRRAFPFALLGASNVLYSRIDLVMLGWLGTKADTGQYGVAVRCLDVALILPVYFGSAFLTTISQSLSASPGTAPTSARVARALRGGLAIGIPASFALALSAPWLVTLAAGSHYGPAGDLVRRLAPLVALVSCYAVLSNLQLARGRSGTLVRILAVGAVAKVVANLLLIPAYGASGAAGAAVAVEALVVLAQWVAARHEISWSLLRPWLPRLLGAILVMALGGLLLSDAAGLPWPLALAGGLILFFSVALGTHALPPGDLRDLRLALTRSAKHPA